MDNLWYVVNKSEYGMGLDLDVECFDVNMVDSDVLSTIVSTGLEEADIALYVKFLIEENRMDLIGPYIDIATQFGWDNIDVHGMFNHDIYIVHGMKISCRNGMWEIDHHVGGYVEGSTLQECCRAIQKSVLIELETLAKLAKSLS